MSIPDDLDQDKLAEAALAILSLSIWSDSSGVRAWKSMDWDLMGLLHEEGWIDDPVGEAEIRGSNRRWYFLGGNLSAETFW